MYFKYYHADDDDGGDGDDDDGDDGDGDDSVDNFTTSYVITLSNNNQLLMTIMNFLYLPC